MKKPLKCFLVLISLLTAITFMGCAKNEPGPLAGTWRVSGVVPMTVQFRSGETEAMGVIEKVSYEVKGNNVLVTYQDGMAKGMAVRYTVINQDAVNSQLGVLRRIR